MEKEKLNHILDNQQIKTVFQPIFSLTDGEVMGYEVLSRFWYEEERIPPVEMFKAAIAHDVHWKLELLCRSTALETAVQSDFLSSNREKQLFINVSPRLLEDEAYDSKYTINFLKEHGIPPSAIAFEITEHNYIDNIEDFKRTVNLYKDQGYLIAIDDVGAGYSGLNLIGDLKPNYIKLDMRLIRDIDSDYIKAALVKGMVEFSTISDTKIIAEGIETYEELETVINLGVHYGQGYFLQKPSTALTGIHKDVKEAIRIAYLNVNRMLQQDVYYYSIKQLTKNTTAISSDKSASDAYDLINSRPDCNGLTIVQKGRPVGIVTKENLALKLSGRYGYTLYQDKPVSQVMDKDFLSFDSKTPINIVSTEAMERPNDKLYDFIVITEDEKYIGTVTIKRMFQKALELKVMTAQQQSPLTGLPGNFLIKQKMGEFIDSGTDYSVAYLDIDYFKAYNDVYGFEKGDTIIKLLADILNEYIPNNQFIGHIGGDDFVVIYDAHVSAKNFDAIRDVFEKAVVHLYAKEDIVNGFTSVMNRQGTIEKTPLIGLTTVVVNNKEQRFNSIQELTERLAHLKSEIKQYKAMNFNM